MYAKVITQDMSKKVAHLWLWAYCIPVKIYVAFIPSKLCPVKVVLNKLSVF